MTYDPTRHRRRSIRLKDYDYSESGAYFVTICQRDRSLLFGDVVTDEMVLNAAGRMVAADWDGLPSRFPFVELDSFVVMPNHLHGIIVLVKDPLSCGTEIAVAVNAEQDPGCSFRSPDATDILNPKSKVLGDVVGAYKSLTTVHYIRGVHENGWPRFRGRLWQRNYHEHVIRNEKSLDTIRRYIEGNPGQWAFDRENPDVIDPDPENPWLG